MTDSGQVRTWLAEAVRVIGGLDDGEVRAAVQALEAVRAGGGTIFTAGNGGSASTASHLALDLQKWARSNGKGTRAIALSDSIGLITAWANDEDFDRVFAAQLATLGAAGDALVVFSVSGSSPNLVRALETARELGMVTVGVLGKDGGQARALVDHAIVVRSNDYGWVESAHLVLEHVLTYSLRESA